MLLMQIILLFSVTLSVLLFSVTLSVKISREKKHPQVKSQTRKNNMAYRNFMQFTKFKPTTMLPSETGRRIWLP